MDLFKKIPVNGEVAELYIEITDKLIISKLVFNIEGKQQIHSLSSTRHPGGTRNLTLGFNASRLVEIWNRHRQEHQALVEAVRSDSESALR